MPGNSPSPTMSIPVDRCSLLQSEPGRSVTLLTEMLSLLILSLHFYRVLLMGTAESFHQ